MNTNLLHTLKTFLFLPLFILVMFTSCQNEESDITDPNTEETFDASSVLAQSILNTTTFDGSFDNIIDSANCISVNLPVTVIVNGITITIESIEGYEIIEDIFDEFENDDDVIEIQFPITIILSNYEEIVINNYDELYTFVEECLGENEEDDDIECIDFKYPITISTFDANFDFIETVEINDDEELYEFIDELEGGVLASINFPVNMVLADGSIIEVNNNDELQTAIEEAENACDEDDDNDYNDDDHDCTEEFVELSLKECIWNIASYNGDDNLVHYDIDFDPNYGFIVSENGNVIHDGSWSVSESDNGLVLGLETSWGDLNGNWTIIICDDDRFKIVNGDNYIILEQECESNNPFECYSDTEMVICDDDTVDGFAAFDLNMAYPNCVEDNVETSFYLTIADAELQTNPLTTPYTNVSNSQYIYVRVQLAGTNDFEVFKVKLYVEDCSTSGCTEEQVDAYLMECHWVAVSYNGDNQLVDYDIYFKPNQDLLVEGNGTSYEGTWSTAGNPADGVYLTISQLPDTLQDLNNQWLVVECTEAQIILHDNNNTEVKLERDCSNNSGNTVDDLMNTVIEGQWLVANYNDSGVDETTDFANWILDFNVDGTVVATNNTTITGTWSGVMNNGQLKMVLDFGTQMPFDEFNDDWDVFDLLANRVELKSVSGGDGTTDVLVFEKF